MAQVSFDFPPDVFSALRRSPEGFAGEMRLAAEIPIDIERWDLGAGEASVLAFAAANKGWEAVLDDLEARRCAAALGIPTTGTVGIVLRARQADLIPAARPALEALLETRPSRC